MDRVRQDPDPYMKFDDTTEFVCTQTDDPNYCSSESRCSRCEYKNGCEYSSGTCNNGSIFISSPSPKYVFDLCESRGDPPNDSNLCGTENLTLNNDSLSSMKPMIATPAGTVCLWNLVSESSISMNLQFNLSDAEEVLVIQISGGVETELIPTGRRNLESNRRQLDITTYTLNEADSVNIYYRTKSDVDSSNFQVALTETVSQPNVTIDDGSGDTDDDDSEVTTKRRKRRTAKDDIILLTIVLVPTCVISICIGATIVTLANKANRRNQNRYRVTRVVNLPAPNLEVIDLSNKNQCNQDSL